MLAVPPATRMKSELTIYQKLQMHNAKTFGSTERMCARLERFEEYERKKQHKLARKQRRMLERAARKRTRLFDENDQPYRMEPEQDDGDIMMETLIILYLVFMVYVVLISAPFDPVKTDSVSL